MKRKRYTEEQIISILKQHEAGALVPGLLRRHAVAENTIHRWKSKFGGMELSAAKRLRELEQENAKLKKLLADAELDKAALKELVEGTGNGRAAAMGHRPLQHSPPQPRRACRLVGFSRSGAWYRPKGRDAAALRKRFRRAHSESASALCPLHQVGVH